MTSPNNSNNNNNNTKKKSKGYLVAMLAVTVELEESWEEWQDDGEGKDVEEKGSKDNPGDLWDRLG